MEGEPMSNISFINTDMHFVQCILFIVGKVKEGSALRLGK